MKTAPWLALILVATALAGCSDDPADDDTDDGIGKDLQATEDTGVIRGVVVDAAIRPIQNVNVSVADGSGMVKAAMTGADGVFGFDGLAPGTYTVKAQKLGYSGTAVPVEVVAAIERPQALRLLLEVDPETTPYYAEYVFDGFIECGFTSPAVGVSLCGLAPEGTVNEDSQVHHPFDRTPTWIQSEMTWSSTQAFGDELALMYSWPNIECDPFYCDHEATGSSPLVLRANETVAQTLVENQTDLYIRVFTDDLDDTKSPACAPESPATNEWCPQGSGITFQQSFRIVTHIFYGYAPPEDWSFGKDRVVPGPPQ